MRLTRAEAARLKGSTRGAITRAVARGLLVAEPDGSGIDPERPDNRRYFEAPKGARTRGERQGDPGGKPSAAEVREKARHPRQGGSARPPRPEASRAFELALAALATKGSVDLRKKQLECEKLELQNARVRAELVPAETAVRTLADLAMAQRNGFLYLPRRAAAQVLALAQSGGDVKAIEEYLAGEIEKALRDFASAAEKRLRDHIAELDVEERQEQSDTEGESA